MLNALHGFAETLHAGRAQGLAAGSAQVSMAAWLLLALAAELREKLTLVEDGMLTFDDPAE